MAEGNMSCGMTENDIMALKETLHVQQQLLQKLYVELDQEREASSSAASEALSMILRLQGEKAAMKMEASQYKRFTEEKICHAEESLAIFEDVIYQKEMEIASLECQIQAYRCKLLSLGCIDVDSDNLVFPGETSFTNSIRRLHSLPQIQPTDFQNNKCFVQHEKPPILMPDLPPKENQDHKTEIQCLNVEKRSGNAQSGNFNFYWERIKRLDEKVKEISCTKDSTRDKPRYLNSASRTCSLPSPISFGSSYDTVRQETIASLEPVKQNIILQEREDIVCPAARSSSCVHDVFEVPKIDETPKTCERQNKAKSKLSVKEIKKKIEEKPDMVSELGNDGLSFNDEVDCVKNMLHCTVHESKIPKKRDEKMKKIPKPRDEKVVDSNNGIVRTTTDAIESQAKFQLLNERIGRLERQRNSTRLEITNAGEEINLLKEIKGQLNLIHAEIYGLRTKKATKEDKRPQHSVMEAMLHFWL